MTARERNDRDNRPNVTGSKKTQPTGVSMYLFFPPSDSASCSYQKFFIFFYFYFFYNPCGGPEAHAVLTNDVVSLKAHRFADSSNLTYSSFLDVDMFEQPEKAKPRRVVAKTWQQVFPIYYYFLHIYPASSC